MSWLEKLLPPKIQQTDPSERRTVPEGLWIKCPSCETVLYKTDLEQNVYVCPKCSQHHRIGARARLDAFLDPEGRYEIGQEVLPVDALKFKDSKKYPERLKAALEDTGETDALVVMGGAVHSIPIVAAGFEFEFMGGSMGSVVGERFVRGVEAATPPVVGCSNTAMYGTRASRSLLRAADVFAICISDSTPSCIRAPPDAQNMIAGRLCATARSNCRAIFSPTTEPIEPPMNSNSKHAVTTGTLCTAPPMTISASVSPVFSSASFRRSVYFLLSLNLSASTGSTSCPIS